MSYLYGLYYYEENLDSPYPANVKLLILTDNTDKLIETLKQNFFNFQLSTINRNCISCFKMCKHWNSRVVLWISRYSSNEIINTNLNCNQPHNTINLQQLFEDNDLFLIK